jgi:hypothetical protein
MIRGGGSVHLFPVILHKKLGEFIKITHAAVFCGTIDGNCFGDPGTPFHFVHVVIVEQLISNGVVVGQDVGQQDGGPEEKQVE